MEAIILNSGVGSRMGALTENSPKCLIKIDGKSTILCRQIEILLEFGIEKIIITTGPFEDKIIQHISDTFPGHNIQFVNNPLYLSTNYIYSLFLTKDLIKADVVLLHGDLVFDKEVFKKLIQSEHENAVVINTNAELPLKDFKGSIKNGMVKEISIDIFDDDCFFLIPLYKFSRKSFCLWIIEIEKFIKEGRVNVYAENALNEIADQVNLYPVNFKSNICTEVDNIEDLENVRILLEENANDI